MAYAPPLMSVWNGCHVGIAVTIVVLNATSYFMMQNAEKGHGSCRNSNVSFGKLVKFVELPKNFHIVALLSLLNGGKFSQFGGTLCQVI